VRYGLSFSRCCIFSRSDNTVGETWAQWWAAGQSSWMTVMCIPVIHAHVIDLLIAGGIIRIVYTAVSLYVRSSERARTDRCVQLDRLCGVAEPDRSPGITHVHHYSSTALHARADVRPTSVSEQKLLIILGLVYSPCGYRVQFSGTFARWRCCERNFKWTTCT